MAPTFEPEEEVTVNLDAYESSEPEVGDAVVFHPSVGADGGTECGADPEPERIPSQRHLGNVNVRSRLNLALRGSRNCAARQPRRAAAAAPCF